MSTKMPPSRTLIILTAYAVIMTMSCSYYFVRDVSRQLNDARNGVDYYEEQFLPVGAAAAGGVR